MSVRAEPVGGIHGNPTPSSSWQAETDTDGRFSFLADPGEYLRTCAALLAPGGLMIVATLNRTLKALALAKVGAEYVLRWLPAGTHDWKKFLKPEELRSFVDGEPLEMAGPYGVAYDPFTGRWSRSSDVDVNYMMVVTKPARA